MTYDVVVQDLHYAYPPPRHGAEPVRVLRGVNLEIARGEFVAVLGRVGAGKTTLCMALNGLVPHATGGLLRGNVTVLGLNTKQHPVANLARHVGIVFQDPESQLTQMRVEDEVAFGLENLGVPAPEIEERLAWALEAVGLSAYRDRSPLFLSGGEKQRVAIAAILAMRPQVLVLDEPTASLDPAGKAAVFNFLAELSRHRQVTIVMATQELERIARFANRLLVLHRGQIALEGPPADVLQQVAVLREWGIGVPQLVELADMLNRRTGHTYRFMTASEAWKQLTHDLCEASRRTGDEVSPTPPLERTCLPLPHAAEEDLTKQAPKVSPLTACPQVVVENLSYTYRDGTTALEDVSLTLSAGDFVALLGPNGSGKTTLAKHFNGLLKPSSGRVLVENHDTRTTRVAQLARSVGYVFQNPDHQIFAPTVHDEIAFGLRAQQLPPAVVAQRVAEALDQFRLVSCAGTPPASLGFAQRRQVALAAVIAVQPKILILDEPTGGLDEQSRRELMEVVAELNTRGQTVILIAHDMPVVAEYASRAIVLLRGRLLFDGPVSVLFDRPELLSQAGLTVPPVKRLANRLSSAGIPRSVLTPAEFASAWQALVTGRRTP